MEKISNSNFHRGLFNCYIQYMRCRTFSTRNYYDVLNLNRTCSHEEVRESFAKLSKQFHPDTCKTGDTQVNSKRFQEILEAYKVLGKKERRQRYDKYGSTSFESNNASGTSSTRAAYGFERRRPGQGPEYYYYYGPGNHERMRQQWQEQQTRQQWNKDEHEFFIKHLMRFLVCAFLANSLLVYLNYKYRSNLMKGFDTVDKYYNIQDYQKAHVARMKEQSDEEKPS